MYLIRPPAVVRRMVRVDRCHRLDMRALRRGGIFTKPVGTLWVVTWPRPSHARMRCRLLDAGEGRLWLGVLDARQASAGGDAPIVQRALMEPVRCRFGGRRWFFRCGCGSRRRVLHLAPGASRFACRVCVPATYESRQCHRDRWYHLISRPLAMMERNVADLGSRSPRRKLQALWRSNPQLVLDAMAKDLEARGVVPNEPEGGTDV